MIGAALAGSFDIPAEGPMTTYVSILICTGISPTTWYDHTRIDQRNPYSAYTLKCSMDKRLQPILVISFLVIILVLILVLLPPPTKQPLPQSPLNLTDEKVAGFVKEYEQTYVTNQVVDRCQDISLVNVMIKNKTVVQTTNSSYVVILDVHTEIRQGALRLRSHSTDYSIRYRIKRDSFIRGINRTETPTHSSCNSTNT